MFPSKFLQFPSILTHFHAAINPSDRGNPVKGVSITAATAVCSAGSMTASQSRLSRVSIDWDRYAVSCIWRPGRHRGALDTVHTVRLQDVHHLGHHGKCCWHAGSLDSYCSCAGPRICISQVVSIAWCCSVMGHLNISRVHEAGILFYYQQL